MRIKVQLALDESVEDWTAFREAFDEAAQKLGLRLEQIIHTETLL